jgi:hypothetical protein
MIIMVCELESIFLLEIIIFPAKYQIMLTLYIFQNQNTPIIFLHCVNII